MTTLTVGLEDIYPKCNTEWDEDACSDFVNQIGKKLEQLGRMDDQQKTDVLLGAHMGGFIRCHELANPQRLVISCKSQKPRQSLFSVFVEFKELDLDRSGMMEIPLIPMFVRDLGSDLEQFRKLTRLQMAEVGCGLVFAGFVNFFLAPEVIQESPAELQVNDSTDPIQSASSRPPTCVQALPNFISTPGLDTGYPTPSTISVETPQTREQHIFSGFEAIIDSQESDTSGLYSDLGKQKTTAEIADNLSHALNMLQSCSVSLENDRIQRILEAEAHLLARSLDSMLSPLFRHWDKYGSLDLDALGLPVQWKGIQAAVDYLRVLDADATSHNLSPVAKRIGHVLLYFNYEELCKYPEKYCPTPPTKRPASHVLDCILDAYSDDPRITKSAKSRRDKISAFYVRRGKWWWVLASNWGAGILLAGDNSPHDVMCNHTFNYPQIQVFVSFVQKTRPGTLRVFRELEPVVNLLMCGRVTYDLRKVIFDKDVGLLRSKEMVSVREDDERALAFQWPEISWKPVDVQKIASQKQTEFLS